MKTKIRCEILIEMDLEIKSESNTDQVVEEIHEHVNKLTKEDFKHFKGIEINGDYNIVIRESEDNDLDKIKLMLGGDDMMEV